MSESNFAEVGATWEIEAACQKLINKISHCLDGHRYGELSALVTADCIFEWAGNKMSVQELVAMFKSYPDNIVSMHVMSTSVFGSVMPDKADCVSYLAYYQGEKSDDGMGKLAAPTALAEYHDSFSNTPDGWRLSSRLVKPTMARND